MNNELNIDYSKLKTHAQVDVVLAKLAEAGTLIAFPEGATVKAKVEAIKLALTPTNNTPSTQNGDVPPSDGPSDAAEPEEVVTPTVTIYKNKIVIRSEVKIMHGKTYMEIGFEDGTTDVVPKEDYLNEVTTK
jgi:hypothetical protein